jgi:hypothetical protein
MSVEKKRVLFIIGIKYLKADLENNDLPMAKEVLAEAIDCVKVEKKWKIGVCCLCEEDFKIRFQKPLF